MGSRFRSKNLPSHSPQTRLIPVSAFDIGQSFRLYEQGQRAPISTMLLGDMIKPLDGKGVHIEAAQLKTSFRDIPAPSHRKKPDCLIPTKHRTTLGR